MTDLSNFELGQTIELQDGRVGTVRYIGGTHFAAGDWIGIELEDASGKNDGAVQGERYFDCDAGHGMFVRPTAAKVVEQPTPKANGNANGKAVEGRSHNGTIIGARRESVLGRTVGKRPSMSAVSPTPGARAPVVPRASRSPSKSPTKQLATARSASGTSSPHAGLSSNTRAPPPAFSTTRPRAGTSNRTSMGPPAAPTLRARQSRQSVAGSVSGSSKPANTTVPSDRAPNKRLSLRPGPVKRLSSISGDSQASESSGFSSGHDSLDSLRPVESRLLPATDIEAPDGSSQRVSSSTLSGDPAAAPSPSLASSRETSSPTLTQKPQGTNTAASREIEDLKTKLRVMEKRRMEDRDKLKVLERIQGERDKFESIIQKLQSKYQPQQQEVAELKKQLRESAAKAQEAESQQSEQEVMVEMATLDREMAEETAEALKTELDALKQKAEELELEVEVLREENQELGKEMSPEEKTSQGWLQMERTNERLREALMRLREITKQQENELKDQIKGLEGDVQDLGAVKEQLETTKQKLSISEAAVEDLMQQLDTALGAEDMLEELTERNMTLSEQLDDMRAAIEDLESLKELNDELELNHLETEKQMQEDIDHKDSLIAEYTRKAAQQDENIGNYEYTIARFRVLVTSMQSDLEDMRASRELTEAESEEMTARSRAMMDLNLKLQMSAAKTQVKTIDLELRQLEAQEAAEHLAIVQLFLPEGYQSDRDSIHALLRFKRVGFKSQLLHGFVKDLVNGQTPTSNASDVFAACDVLDKLTWVTAMCKRFINYMSSCSVEQFSRFEGALYELEPVERALNGWIETLRRDELKEKKCAEELQRTISLMSHLAEVHISESLESYADDIIMRTLLMQSNLENVATALSQSEGMIQSKVPVIDGDEEGEEFCKRLETLISHSRSAKVVVSKTVRQLEELKARSLALHTETLPSFLQCEDASASLSAYARNLGTSLFDILNEEGRSAPFTYGEISSALSSSTESDSLSTFSQKLRSLTTHLTDLHNLTQDLSQTLEFERSPHPWLLRSRALRSAHTVTPAIEQELTRLKEALHSNLTQLKIKDQTLEESAVKIELLESRTRDAASKTTRITELEKTLSSLSNKEKDLTAALEARTKQLQTLEAERKRRKKVVNDDEQQQHQQPTKGSKAERKKEGAARAVAATARETTALRAEIASLQACVRYLRDDARRARLDPDTTLSWLSEPLVRKQKSVKEERAGLVAAEGADVYNELLHLAGTSTVVKLPEGGVGELLRWRPRKESTVWKVCRQREEWEVWKGWRDEVAAKGRIVLADRGSAGRRVVAKSSASSVVGPKFLSGAEKYGEAGEVRIVGSGDEDEGYGERMGVV
ncbi:MAG: hypothetical protein M1835_005634 [Candelina submexicana]|nr:MAG: hypothetical protein M1835_005634 [Candelina submexicana]